MGGLATGAAVSVCVCVHVCVWVGVEIERERDGGGLGIKPASTQRVKGQGDAGEPNLQSTNTPVSTMLNSSHIHTENTVPGAAHTLPTAAVEAQIRPHCLI